MSKGKKILAYILLFIGNALLTAWGIAEWLLTEEWLGDGEYSFIISPIVLAAVMTAIHLAIKYKLKDVGRMGYAAVCIVSFLAVMISFLELFFLPLARSG